MDIEITPWIDVGPLRAGMRRGQIRAILEAEVHEFYKGEAKVSTDAFDSIDIYVFYDEQFFPNINVLSQRVALKSR